MAKNDGLLFKIFVNKKNNQLIAIINRKKLNLKKKGRIPKFLEVKKEDFKF